MTLTSVEQALDDDPKAELLRSMLTIAVPLWMDQRRHESDEDLINHARIVWGHRASKQHEALLYRVKAHRRNGENIPGTAEVFNHFADAVACMALVADGGINVLGLHFCPGGCGRCKAAS